MKRKTKSGCLSRLFFVAAVCYAFFVIFSHGQSSEMDPIAWKTAGKVFAILLGLSFLFRLTSARHRKDETDAPGFTVTVEAVVRGSDDISASARQLEYIKALGGTPKKSMTMSQASAMIDKLKIEREIQQRKEIKQRLSSVI